MSCPSASVLCESSWFNTDAPQGGCASSASWSRYIGSVKILWVWGRKISAQTTQLLPRNQTAIISFTVQPRSTCLNMICQRCTHDHAGCIVADLCLNIKRAENRKTHLQHWNWIGMNSVLLVVPWIFPCCCQTAMMPRPPKAMKYCGQRRENITTKTSWKTMTSVRNISLAKRTRQGEWCAGAWYAISSGFGWCKYRVSGTLPSAGQASEIVWLWDQRPFLQCISCWQNFDCTFCLNTRVLMS